MAYRHYIEEPEWVSDVLSDAHPVVSRDIEGCLLNDYQKAVRRYPMAVLSLIFDALDDPDTPIPPYQGDIAKALNRQGITTQGNQEWTGRRVTALLKGYDLFDELVARRTPDNMAHLRRIQETGKYSIRQCLIPDQR